MLQTILFFIFAALSVAGGIMVISLRNPVYSALSLVLTLFALAGEYVLLLAHFIAIVHIAVYAGAIVVLFLFVIMLLNIRSEERVSGSLKYMVYIGVPLGIILFYELGSIAFKEFNNVYVRATDIGTVEKIGLALFSKYVLPFEITSILLLVAMLGAIYFSKQKLEIVKK